MIVFFFNNYVAQVFYWLKQLSIEICKVRKRIAAMLNICLIITHNNEMLSQCFEIISHKYEIISHNYEMISDNNEMSHNYEIICLKNEILSHN